MRAGRRRAPWIVAGVILALVALHGAVWLWATERLRTDYEAWVVAMRAAGWTVDGGTPSRAGWPLAAELEIPSPALAGNDALVPGGVAWHTEAVRLRLSPLAPRTLELVPEGVQHVGLAALPEAAVTAGQLTVAVPLSGEEPTALAGQAIRISAAGTSVGVTTLHAWLLPGGIRAEAGEIALPQGYAWPLGATVAAASAEVQVTGTLAPDQPGTTASQAAARWRDAGGRIDVPSLALRWGPLTVAGSGTGGLDERLQPRAEATLHLEGWQAALDRLVQGGAVTPGVALAARAALGLFARASQAGSPGSVTVPVLIRDGLLYAGGIPLLKVPALTWP